MHGGELSWWGVVRIRIQKPYSSCYAHLYAAFPRRTPIPLPLTLTDPTHHVEFALHAVSWDTPGGMVEAMTAAPHYHLVDGVVVLVEDIVPIVEQVVTQEVELGEVDPEVGDLDHVLDLLAVGVIDVDVGRQHFEDDLQSRGQNICQSLPSNNTQSNYTENNINILKFPACNDMQIKNQQCTVYIEIGIKN